jgi:polyphosphate kinase
MSQKKAHQHETKEAEPAKPAAASEPQASASPAPLKKRLYREELAGLQVEMFKLQQWVAGDGQPAVVILEGLGPAGKHRTAEAIIEGLHKRVGQVVTLVPPKKRERGQWHFQRFVEHFPGAGKIVIFDGSWYHYPATERALGLCSEPDFADFLRRCAAFEKTLTESGVTLVKYWFSAEDQEQDRRFRTHIADSQKHKQFYLPDYTPNCDPLPVGAVRDAILGITDQPVAPWYVVTADDKRRARLNCMRHLLSLVPGEQPASDTTRPEPDEAIALDRPATRLVPEVF